MTTDTRNGENATGVKRFIPILSWLPSYDRSWLTVDIIAGLTLWGLVVQATSATAALLASSVAAALVATAATNASDPATY